MYWYNLITAQGTKQTQKRCKTQEKLNIIGREAGENRADVICANGKELQKER